MVNFIDHLGDYWIDPNSGVPNDAVLVHCVFESSATCFMPNNLKVKSVIDLSIKLKRKS